MLRGRRSCGRADQRPWAYRIENERTGRVVEGSDDGDCFGAGEKLEVLLRRWDVRNVLLVVAISLNGAEHGAAGRTFKCVLDEAKAALQRCYRAAAVAQHAAEVEEISAMQAEHDARVAAQRQAEERAERETLRRRVGDRAARRLAGRSTVCPSPALFDGSAVAGAVVMRGGQPFARVRRRTGHFRAPTSGPLSAAPSASARSWARGRAATGREGGSGTAPGTGSEGGGADEDGWEAAELRAVSAYFVAAGAEGDSGPVPPLHLPGSERGEDGAAGAETRRPTAPGADAPDDAVLADAPDGAVLAPLPPPVSTRSLAAAVSGTPSETVRRAVRCVVAIAEGKDPTVLGWQRCCQRLCGARLLDDLGALDLSRARPPAMAALASHLRAPGFTVARVRQRSAHLAELVMWVIDVVEAFHEVVKPNPIVVRGLRDHHATSTLPALPPAGPAAALEIAGRAHGVGVEE